MWGRYGRQSEREKYEKNMRDKKRETEKKTERKITREGKREDDGERTVEREVETYLIVLAADVLSMYTALVFFSGKQQLWNDDQGFFKINQVLAGDFVVIARFKGTDGGAQTGPDGVLFRYCNHTCFLPAGQVMLRKRQVRICWCRC